MVIRTYCFGVKLHCWTAVWLGSWALAAACGQVTLPGDEPDAAITADGPFGIIDAPEGGCPGWDYSPEHVAPCSLPQFGPELSLDQGGEYVYQTDSGQLFAPSGVRLDHVGVPLDELQPPAWGLLVDRLYLGPDTLLRVEGSRPLIAVSASNMIIEGGIDASSENGRVGAGGDPAGCLESSGEPGAQDPEGGGGGGGGGMYGTGGDGSRSDDGGEGGRGGVLMSDDFGLRGGCRGGQGGAGSGSANGSGIGGSGGGAVELVAAEDIFMAGRISTGGAGGGGANSNFGGSRDGGGGGGSGGMVRFDAPVVVVAAGAIVAANGGGGGWWHLRRRRCRSWPEWPTRRSAGTWWPGLCRWRGWW